MQFSKTVIKTVVKKFLSDLVCMPQLSESTPQCGGHCVIGSVRCCVLIRAVKRVVSDFVSNTHQLVEVIQFRLSIWCVYAANTSHVCVLSQVLLEFSKLRFPSRWGVLRTSRRRGEWVKGRQGKRTKARRGASGYVPLDCVMRGVMCYIHIFHCCNAS